MSLELLRYSLTVLSNCVICLRPLCLIEISNSQVTFEKTLWHVLGTKLKFSTAFHPQTNNQTEVVNMNLENLLCTLVGEHIKTWDLKPATAKFAYNTTVNRTTRKSPHEIVYGFKPR